MSGSLTGVFHQETLNYHLSPSFEPRKKIWKLKTKRTLQSIKTLGLAVLFASSLYSKQYRKRKKVIQIQTRNYESWKYKTFNQSKAKLADKQTDLYVLIILQAHVFYGTTTGRSKKYAIILHKQLDQVFQASIDCLSDDCLQKLHIGTKIVDCQVATIKTLINSIFQIMNLHIALLYSL